MFISLVHATILTAQILVGLTYSSSPLLWLQCYVELSVTLCTGLMCLCLLSRSLFTALGGAPLQPSSNPSSPMLSEALESCRAMLVFSGFAAWPRLLLVQGHPTALHFTLAGAQPEAPTSLALYCLKLLLVTLLVDAYMYFKHRALHHPALFCFHKQHHGFPNPTSFASFAVAPVEAVLTFAPVLALCLPQAPVWAHAYACWTAGFVALNLYLHSGVRLEGLEGVLKGVGLNTSVFHNIHHESGGSQNFGELLYVWDSILGSGAHTRKGKLQ